MTWCFWPVAFILVSAVVSLAILGYMENYDE